jgi:actin-like ATPase involved in cell morphogenesis
MRAIGIDLGFRQVNVAEEEVFKFDSVIGYPSAIELTSEEEVSPLENMVLIDGESMYYVGAKAIRDTKNAQLTFTTHKTDSKTDRIKYMAALGNLIDEQKPNTFRVVTGLPVDEMGVEGLKEKLVANMTGTFHFQLNGKLKTAIVEKVNVIAQSAGAYYDYILDDNGTILHENIKPKDVVIDIGYRTTDVVTMSEARFNPAESFTVFTGVHNIHMELRKILLKKFGIVKHPVEMDTIVRNGYIMIGDKQISLIGEIHEATRPVAEKILAEIPLSITNVHEITTVLLAGGGAPLMVDYFMEAFQSPVKMAVDCEHANARGYRKYLLLLMQNGK